jgi:hypothetical protein
VRKFWLSVLIGIVRIGVAEAERARRVRRLRSTRRRASSDAKKRPSVLPDHTVLYLDLLSVRRCAGGMMPDKEN